MDDCVHECFLLLTSVGKISQQLNLQYIGGIVPYGLYVAALVLFKRFPSAESAKYALSGLVSRSLRSPLQESSAGAHTRQVFITRAQMWETYLPTPPGD
jgi:hypothetical protein